MTDTTNHAAVIREALESVSKNSEYSGGIFGPNCRFCDDYGGNHFEGCEIPKVREALAALDALTRELENTTRSLRTQADYATELEKAEAAQSEYIKRLESAVKRDMGEDYLSLQALYINQLNEAKIKDARIAMLKEALTLYMKASIAITNHATAHGWDGIMPDEFGWIKEAPARAHIALATSKGERLNVPRVIEPDIESKEARP